jgi:diguanylate cyclase (GGDEF)-like protein
MESASQYWSALLKLLASWYQTLQSNSQDRYSSDLDQLSVDEKNDLLARLRAKQLEAVTRLTPLNALANVFNTLVTLFSMWSTANESWLLLWAAMILGTVSIAISSWYRLYSRDKLPERASTKVMTAATAHAALLALLWSVPPVLLYASGSEEQRLYITAVTTGMMCAGSFALYTMPRAALSFLGILGAASFVSLLLLQQPIAFAMMLTLAIFVAILTLNVLHAARIFRAHAVGEMLSENQTQVISLLLNDFEQSTADVLWEVDEKLTLQRASDKLALLFGEHQRSLNGDNLLSLIRYSQSQLPPKHTAQANASYRQLQRALQKTFPFREIEIPMWVNRQTVWWAITANPTANRGWRGVISNITENREARDRIWHLAHRDPLTGLENRHCFQLELEKTLLAGPGEELHALICMDLDRFKPVNDAFGHDTGDELLKVIAERLLAQTRQPDVVARLGGDEFGIILRSLENHQQAEQIASRLIRSLAQPCRLGNATVTVGASIGIAFIPEDGGLQEVILKHADMALYKAKEDGRGCFRRFSQDMAAKAHSRHRIEHALRKTLKARQMSLVYQPQRHLRTGHIDCLEVLARWRDPELGEVEPKHFIDIAEETGLINELGRCVLEQSLEQLSRWPKGTVIAINMSPLEMANPGLVDNIRSALIQHGISPNQLEIEITENSLLDERHDVLAKLTELNQLGVNIALDDFGTGYSSLSYLRRFPFSKLKIDQSFVQELKHSASAKAIVSSTIEMARAMKMKVVAEGIEDLETLEELRKMDCDMAQGYYLFKPMRAEQYTQVVVHQTPY